MPYFLPLVAFWGSWGRDPRLEAAGEATVTAVLLIFLHCLVSLASFDCCLYFATWFRSPQGVVMLLLVARHLCLLPDCSDHSRVTCYPGSAAWSACSRCPASRVGYRIGECELGQLGRQSQTCFVSAGEDYRRGPRNASCSRGLGSERRLGLS